MRICPVFLDSRPGSLRGGGPGASLLLVPLGTKTVIEHLCSWLEPITRNPPIILPPAGATPEHRRRLRSLSPMARVVPGREELADLLAGYGPADAILVIDPRYLPIREPQLSALLRHYSAEPRAAHHLVAFEMGIAGTKERVSLDKSGQIRGIHRYYEPATWPFIAGVAATFLPVACGVLGDALIPISLAEVRQVLAARGVPSRDVPIEGGAFDLAQESGLLAASEKFILSATDSGLRGGFCAGPLYVGGGHSIHPTARIVGPVVIHANARIEENATVLGPTLIGASACIAANAVVARAAVGPDCTVPRGRIVRERTWFESGDGVASADVPPLSYGDRLARLTVETIAGHQDREDSTPHRDPRLKRCFDVTVAALSLIVLSPLLIVVAIMIRLESNGSIFYGDKREGLRGRVFRCWKFRTMFIGADIAQKDLSSLDHTDGPHFKVDRDPRVTRIGRFLRAVNVDEIPQLLNLLVGQMSLIGPRPSPFHENQVCVPWRDARLSVRPGITGLWQVARHNRSAGDFHQWIEYDLLYVQHLSLWLDLKILAATIVTLGGKATHVPVPWLVRGPLAPHVEPSSAPDIHSQAVHRRIRADGVVPRSEEVVPT